MIDTNQVSAGSKIHCFPLENQVMRLIGELLVKNRSEMSIEDQEKKRTFVETFETKRSFTQ